MLDQSSYCYQLDEIKTLKIDQKNCKETDHPIQSTDIDPEISVRGVITFPPIAKNERPNYTFILNPMDPNNSNFLRKW